MKKSQDLSSPNQETTTTNKTPSASDVMLTAYLLHLVTTTDRTPSTSDNGLTAIGLPLLFNGQPQIVSLEGGQDGKHSSDVMPGEHTYSITDDF